MSPPGPDVPDSFSLSGEADEGVVSTAGTGASGRAVLIGEVGTVPLQGPADLARDDWTALRGDRG